MLLTKLDSRETIDQTRMEGLWLAGVGFLATLGTEAYAARAIGYGAVDPVNIALAVAYILPGIGLWKRIPWLAWIGVALPLIHIAYMQQLLFAIFDVIICYFLVNGARAAGADAPPAGDGDAAAEGDQPD